MSNTENYYGQNYSPDAWAMNQMALGNMFMPPMNSKGELEPYDLDTQGKYRNALQDVMGSMDDPGWALISGLGATDPRAFDPIQNRKPIQTSALTKLKLAAAGTGIEGVLAGMILPVEEGGQGMSALQAAGALRASLEDPSSVADGSMTPERANELMAQLPPIEKKNQYGQSTNEMTGDLGHLAKLAEGLATPLLDEQAMLQQPGVIQDEQGRYFTTEETPSPMMDFLAKSGLPDPRAAYDQNYLMQTDPDMPSIMEKLTLSENRVRDAKQAFQKYLGERANRERYTARDERNQAAYAESMKRWTAEQARKAQADAAGGVAATGSRRSTPEEQQRAMANAVLFGGASGTTTSAVGPGTGRDMSDWIRTINPDGSINYAAPGHMPPGGGTVSAVGPGTGRDMSDWIRTITPEGTINYAAPGQDNVAGQSGRTLSAVGTPMGEETIRAKDWIRSVGPDGKISYTSPHVAGQTFSAVGNGPGRDMSDWIRTVKPDGSINYAAPGSEQVPEMQRLGGGAGSALDFGAMGGGSIPNWLGKLATSGVTGNALDTITSGGKVGSALSAVSPAVAAANVLRGIFSGGGDSGGGGGGGASAAAPVDPNAPPTPPIVSLYTKPNTENPFARGQWVITNAVRARLGLPPLPDPMSSNPPVLGPISDVNQKVFAAKREHGNAMAELMKRDLEMKMLARRGRTPFSDALKARMAPFATVGATGQYGL